MDKFEIEIEEIVISGKNAKFIVEIKDIVGKEFNTWNIKSDLEHRISQKIADKWFSQNSGAIYDKINAEKVLNQVMFLIAKQSLGER